MNIYKQRIVNSIDKLNLELYKYNNNSNIINTITDKVLNNIINNINQETISYYSICTDTQQIYKMLMKNKVPIVQSFYIISVISGLESDNIFDRHISEIIEYKKLSFSHTHTYKFIINRIIYDIYESYTKFIDYIIYTEENVIYIDILLNMKTQFDNLKPQIIQIINYVIYNVVMVFMKYNENTSLYDYYKFLESQSNDSELITTYKNQIKPILKQVLSSVEVESHIKYVIVSNESFVKSYILNIIHKITNDNLNPINVVEKHFEHIYDILKTFIIKKIPKSINNVLKEQFESDLFYVLKILVINSWLNVHIIDVNCIKDGVTLG